MVEVPEEEAEFMSVAGAIFGEATRLTAGSNDSALFSATMALLIKSFNRSLVNVKTEWEIDSEQFVKDTLEQSLAFVIRIRNNIISYPFDDEEAMDAGHQVDEASETMIRFFQKESFKRYLTLFIAGSLKEAR